eukprot:892234-Prymnesium_polylepis.1
MNSHPHSHPHPRNTHVPPMCHPCDAGANAQDEHVRRHALRATPFAQPERDQGARRHADQVWRVRFGRR